MFTCMDITMAPWGAEAAGDVFSGQIFNFFFLLEINTQGQDFFKEREMETQEPISQWGHNKSLLS